MIASSAPELPGQAGSSCSASKWKEGKGKTWAQACAERSEERTRCASPRVIPRRKTRLCRDLAPAAKMTSPLGRSKRVARYSVHRRLAAPSTGGEVRRILRASPCIPATALRLALGWTWTSRRTPSTVGRRHGFTSSRPRAPLFFRREEAPRGGAPLRSPSGRDRDRADANGLREGPAGSSRRKPCAA